MDLLLTHLSQASEATVGSENVTPPNPMPVIVSVSYFLESTSIVYVSH